MVEITSLFGGSMRLLHLPKSYPIHCTMVSASNTFGSGHLKLQNKEPCEFYSYKLRSECLVYLIFVLASYLVEDLVLDKTCFL